MNEIFKNIVSRIKSIYSEREAQSIAYELIEFLFNCKRTDIFTTKSNYKISVEEKDKLEVAIKKLLNNVPIQQIIGKTFFCNCEIKVSNDVLIPRPETEELVSTVVNENTLTFPRIIDIGTGSGCIAIALKKEIPKSEITAIDFSEEALMIAKGNSDLNNVSIIFNKINILEKTERENIKGEFDFIVSNPPYVRESEKNLMHKNVLEHEPEKALFVSDDNPLIFYKEICEFAKSHLKKGGKLFFEINEALGKDVVELLKMNGFFKTKILKDSFDKDRILVSEK